MIPEVRSTIASLLGGQESLNWKGIVWHHSATLDRVKFNDIAAIKLFHTSYVLSDKICTKEQYEAAAAKQPKPPGLTRPPYSNVGYHFLIEYREGILVWEFGRPLSKTGAHAKDFNNSHLGFCLVGNFSKSMPWPQQWKDCLEVTRVFMEYFEIQKERVLGHRETFLVRGIPVQKDCPGNGWSMERFREQL